MNEEAGGDGVRSFFLISGCIPQYYFFSVFMSP